MPSFRVHLIGGVASYFIVSKLMTLTGMNLHGDYHQHILFLGLALLGSIFPDIDIASKMQMIFFKTVLVILPVLLFFQYFITFMCLGIVSLALIIVRHRTLTHRSWFLGALSLAIGVTMSIKYPEFKGLSLTGSAYFFIGGISHLLLDYGIKRFFKQK